MTGGPSANAEQDWAWGPLFAASSYRAVWASHFGHGAKTDLIKAPGIDVLTVTTRRRRVLELGERFWTVPEDGAWVGDRRKRFLPLRQLSPAMALEAGNSRGSIRWTGPTDFRALGRALAAQPGWEYAQIPIPVNAGQEAVTGMRDAGLLPVMRKTGRVFSGLLKLVPWDEFQATKSRNFRKNQRRITQRLEAANARVSRWEGSGLEQGFARLQACAERSWKAQTADAKSDVQVPLTPRQLAFFKDLADQPELGVVIFSVEQGEDCLAVALWVKSGAWMTGGVTYHDHDARVLSPGHAMMQQAIDRFHAVGIRHLDFNATSEWVTPYADVSAEFGNLILCRDTLLGRGLHRLACRDATDPFADGAPAQVVGAA